MNKIRASGTREDRETGHRFKFVRTLDWRFSSHTSVADECRAMQVRLNEMDPYTLHTVDEWVTA